MNMWLEIIIKVVFVTICLGILGLRLFLQVYEYRYEKEQLKQDFLRKLES
jgi:hypothetical protein